MKLTNQLGLPQPIVNAIANDDYTKGDCDFSTTQLLRPVRINVLLKRHRKEITEDVSDRIFALFGKSMHKVLELGANPRYCMVEKRYSIDVEVGGVKFVVSGQFDLLDYLLDRETGVLSDYKLCSRYVVGDGVKPEWEQQMNINALILRSNGLPVKSLQIIAIFRDWSKMRAAQKEDYPDKQIQVLPVKIWPEQKTLEFIQYRIQTYILCESFPPVCTPDERWRKPDKWAVVKRGLKRATKLYETKEQANAAIKGSITYVVEPRPGEDVRCRYYCPVNKFCDYWQSQNEKIAAA